MILNSRYIDAFNEIMMLNPCKLLFDMKVVSQTNCESFADSSVSQVNLINK